MRRFRKNEDTKLKEVAKYNRDINQMALLRRMIWWEEA